MVTLNVAYIFNFHLYSFFFFFFFFFFFVFLDFFFFFFFTFCQYLTLCMLGKKFDRRHFEMFLFFSLFFRENSI